MYASERSLDLTFYEIGGEAHGDNSSLFFFAGSVYVKIRSSIKYNGDIPGLWKGQYIIGIFNENGQTVPEAYKIINSVALQ